MPRLALIANASLEDMAQQSKLAEDLGYDSFWVTEGDGKEAFATLTALARYTKRIKLGSGVALIYSRVPTLLAMSAVTADEVAGGRLLLGLGVGRASITDLTGMASAGMGSGTEVMYGVPFQKPVARMRDYIAIIRQALNGKTVQHKGEAFSIDGFRLAFKPMRADVPIYMAAQGPRMMELAGEAADGVLFSNVSPEYIKGILPRLRAGAEKAGRDPSRIDVGCLIFAAPDWSKTATASVWKAIAQRTAMPHYRKMLEGLGFAAQAGKVAQAISEGSMDKAIKLTPKELVESLPLVGDPASWGQRLQAYRDAGVALPVVRPATSPPDTLKLFKETAHIFGIGKT